MQLADFLSAVFFYLKVGENLNQNWIVENLNNAFSTWNGKLGELWGLVTTGPQTFKGGAVWSVMQTLHNGMVGILCHCDDFGLCVLPLPWLEHCAGGFGRAAPRCNRYDCLCRYLVDDSGTIRPTYSSSRFEQL